MKKTIYMVLMLTGIIGVTTAITGCSNPIKAENVDLSQEISKVSQENQELKEEIKQLQQNNQELDEEITKLDPSRTEKDTTDSEVKESESIFSIYGANVDTYERELLKEITIEDDLTLEEKLQILAQDLSQTRFGNQGIEITKIEDQDGKKIATINLTEVANSEDKSWETGYFQGSTGGIITTIALQETFLQRDYQGDWIDGVIFLHEGGQIQFGHVEELGEISFR